MILVINILGSVQIDNFCIEKCHMTRHEYLYLSVTLRGMMRQETLCNI